MVLTAKKDVFKLWQLTKHDIDLENYNDIKKHTKTQVAISIAETKSDFYSQLESANLELRYS